MTLELINEVELETARFLERLLSAKKRIEKEGYHASSGCRETGALKRAALDLKLELTRLNKPYYE